jgi:hypothetical protein
VAATLVFSSKFAFAQLDPIPEDWAKALSAVRPDPPPERLTRDSHYWVSDEMYHLLFREAISNKGGVFVGIGPDQNYLMAGWARPEVLIPLDFDQAIIDLHYVYRMAFLTAETPEAFRAMWAQDKEEEFRALLEKEYADSKQLKGILKAFKRTRPKAVNRFNRVLRLHREKGISTFLDDAQQYAYVRGLHQTGRVFPVRGDLTAERTVRDIAQACKTIGLEVKVLYLSNTEQYFDYTQTYKQNMLGLPLAQDSVVLRTAGMAREWSPDGLYEYVVQDGPNFHRWMEDKRTAKVWRILSARIVDKKTGLSTITVTPEEMDAQAAARQKSKNRNKKQ